MMHLIKKLNLMLITSSGEMADFAQKAGVNRIFVDLEILGKKERQGHLNTLISNHTLADVVQIRQSVQPGCLLVRINPLHAKSQDEVNDTIAAGADLIMLPMIRTVDDVRQFLSLTKNRIPVVPLIETASAAACLDQIVNISGLHEIYIGLNDLHLDLKMHFMFEPLANGLIDQMASTIRQAGLPFGFGGIARIGEGHLSGELVLAEHLRLGSSSVILSRTFHRNAQTLQEMESTTNLAFEIAKLREVEAHLRKRTPEEIALDREKVVEIIRIVAKNKGLN
jgi:2-keto-3-deoxy-L-rhamnonate aldolase RhmA